MGVFLILITFVSFGCASKGFNRVELKKQIGVKTPVVDDEEIAKILAKKPNLPKPFKLALYFNSPVHTGVEKPNWRWSESDLGLVHRVAEQLKSEGLISQVFPIVGSIVKDEDLRSIRIAAAKHGADAVMIVSGASSVDRYTNSWAWTYMFLVPALFVAGSEADTLFLTSAAMWDVRNEYLYLTAEAEAVVHDTYVPVFGKRQRDMVNEAKHQALNRLAEKIVEMVKGVKN